VVCLYDIVIVHSTASSCSSVNGEVHLIWTRNSGSFIDRQLDSECLRLRKTARSEAGYPRRGRVLSELGCGGR
jgi:hypothetical protein